MKTIESPAEEAVTIDRSRPQPSGRKHVGRGISRQMTWRVLGTTVAGFPVFLWQLTKSRN